MSIEEEIAESIVTSGNRDDGLPFWNVFIPARNQTLAIFANDEEEAKSLIIEHLNAYYASSPGVLDASVLALLDVLILKNVISSEEAKAIKESKPDVKAADLDTPIDAAEAAIP